MRILLVEDDKVLSDQIAKRLRELNFNVAQTFDGEEALNYIKYEPFDIIILDLMLPKVHGYSILETIKVKDINTPILILSAKSEIEDKVRGLSIGADDYLTKPFSFPELIARINALLRRSKKLQDILKLKYEDLSLDVVKKEVRRGEKKIDLTAKEFDLLKYFLENAEKIVTRNMILENVFDIDFEIESNIVDVHIHRLREKIDKKFEKKLIHTIRGFGYVLKSD
ncbi:MAG: response regulator transcription factor [Hydrogenothermaceae bacterium]|nr:response regulator transcription factor [Hydrogenothermaceae bacterium]